MPYNPPRQSTPQPPIQPLEIELVHNVRSCGTCRFFWPDDPAQQPYGPYPSYDFDSNFPKEQTSTATTGSFVWIQGTTQPGCFPEPEVMDGCRKAPIMTIGINPNLTAFGPGPTGASWSYPSFSSAAGTDAFAKYAYYYRYRSVYQEHFNLRFSELGLLPDGQIRAANAGAVVDFVRVDDSPAFEIRIQYDSEASPTAIHLPGKLGEPQYVILFDKGSRFAAGDLLAAKLNVAPGKKTDIYAEAITYYTQLLPVLSAFESFLEGKGHPAARVRIGEDVGQLDMVACASPHWGPQWLGGTSQSVNTVVKNCVQKNAWAMKQLLQTRPAILFLVGQSSWTMFRNSFGHLVKGPSSLPNVPEDGPYTLFRLTTQNDYRIAFSTTVASTQYDISTRIVITPHFSYNINFLPQFRLSPAVYEAFAAKYPNVAHFLSTDPRLALQQPKGAYVSAGIQRETSAVLSELASKFNAAYAVLKPSFYDPHNEMAAALGDLYTAGDLTWAAAKDPGAAGYLSRGAGPCQFCENSQWTFPQRCPYDKPRETQFPIGFLEQVARRMMEASIG